jgi:hypothetical protein
MVLLLRWLPKSFLCALAMLAGCGLIYDAGARVRTDRMMKQLKPGESTLQVHREWGEPDLRKDVSPRTEMWSYASRPNANDFTATIFYTSTKPGDSGKFLDLKFIDGKLVSWNEVRHTMPSKQGTGFSYGVGPGGGASNVSHY